MANTDTPVPEADATVDTEAKPTAAKPKRTAQPKVPTKTGKKRAGRKGGGESKHSPRRIESVEKQQQALEYRKMGLSYSQIAEKLGISTQGAWNAVESALQRVLQEPADEVRKIELARLDAMFIPVYGNACRGDLMALAGAITIMNRRARLLGLDAVVRNELTGANGAPLQTVAPTIYIGGAAEPGEPDVAGQSVVVKP